MALAGAEPRMAEAPEMAGLCALGMTQGKVTQWASSPSYHCTVHCLALAYNAAASFLVASKKQLFFFSVCSKD